MRRFIVFLIAALTIAPAWGQDAPEATGDAARFAPGTLTVIPPEPMAEETFAGPVTLEELLKAHPEIEWQGPDFPENRPFFDARSRTLVEMARQVVLRREIYALEFSFKPLRQMHVDVPLPSGRMQRKLIWYMVYRVRYRGGDLRPQGETTGESQLFSKIERIGYDSRRFFPLMVLSNRTYGKEYVDRIIPAARQEIARREKITSPLYNSVEITSVPIPRTSDPSAPGVWGVVTWEDVDPRIDFFSVYVYGLTNATERVVEDGQQKYLKKALRLNFYRPGDTVREHADRIRFGIPAFENPVEQQYVLEQFGLSERLDYQWVFR